MALSIQSYRVVHSSPEIVTVGAYVSDIASPARKYVKRVSEFLDTKWPDGLQYKTNRESVIGTLESLGAYVVDRNKNKSDEEIELAVNTVFYIPVEEVDLVGILTQGLQITSNSDTCFKAKQLVDIESEVGYVQLYDRFSKGLRDQVLSGVTKEYQPYLSVWCWCRALSDTNDVGQSTQGSRNNNLDGSIVDLTPFISNLSTSVTKSGGNFNFKLPPLTCTFQNGQWVVKRATLKKYINPDTGREEYVSESSLYDGVHSSADGKSHTNYGKRSQFLFHNIINANDLIFIRFETLKSEKKRQLEVSKDMFVDKSKLAGNIYDMIGLVDTNTLNVNPGTSDVSIDISGRDLIKLFIEDNCYVYDLESVQGELRVAGATVANQKNQLLMRMISDHSLYYLSLYQNTSLEHIFKFVIYQLSNIEVVPTELFSSYKGVDEQGNIVDRRNVKITPKSEMQQKSTTTSKLRQQRDSIVLQIGQSNGVEVEVATQQFTKFYQFLRWLREDNVRINQGKQTVGWYPTIYNGEVLGQNQTPLFLFTEGYYIVQSAKFNRYTDDQVVTIFQMIDAYIDDENSQNKSLSENRSNEELAPGIWQIVKLIIDRSVIDRRVIDSSLSRTLGSLLSYFRKVCKEPFVEFFSDTYGDCFYLTVRKPPFDKVGVQSYLSGKIQIDAGPESQDLVLNQGTTITDKLAPIIDIEDYDVIRENLNFSQGEDAYAWYHFKPRNNGFSRQFPQVYVPALMFPEYAEIWGAKTLELEHNYNPYYETFNKDGRSDATRFEEQAVWDFKYLVDSNQYNPFVRKGTLTLNGDRRIKRGNFIRYKSTGEIFYVDGVTQNFSISETSVERTTNINVTRGMVEQFIYGVKVPGIREKVSYFNIIDTSSVDKGIKYKDNPKQTVTFKEEIQSPIPDTNPVEYELKEVTVTREIPGYTGVDLNNAIGSFKVNIDVFNFFLKKEQFNYRQYQKVPDQVNNQSGNNDVVDIIDL